MPTTIDHVELQALTAAGAQLVEVLPTGEYADMHLPGWQAPDGNALPIDRLSV